MEQIRIAILPVLGFILFAVQVPQIWKGFTKKNAILMALGLIVMGVSIYNEAENNSDKKSLNNKITEVRDSVNMISDTLIRTKDTLIKIGLRIDEKTGKLLVMDSLLLKKEFKQIFSYNPTFVTNPPLPDERKLASDNFVVREVNDSVYIYPKTGTWVHGYFAHDTANSKTFISHMTEGMGTPNEYDPINIGGKIYKTHIWKMYDRAVYAAKPIALKLIGYKNRYIIFGDEGIPYKRYIYQSGKVTWIPED